MDDDVERQATHGDKGIPNEKTRKVPSVWWSVGIAVTIIVLFGVVGPIVQAEYFTVETQYSVGIDSVSGLDPKTGLSFNLTLSVTSRSHGAKACINPGMFVEVFYHGVQLASSEAETHQVCAGPRKMEEMHVVARATGVPVGHVLDNLAAEMRQGAAVFDFMLHIPANSYGGIAAEISWVMDCKGTRVGDAAVLCESPDQF